MNVTTYPKAYQSAFREACFVLDALPASQGVDVEISSPAYAGTLGVKRIYSAGKASVNAAPYVRRLLSPEPLCGKPFGVVAAAGRTVPCRVSAQGQTSPAVYLAAGSEDTPLNTIISAAPGVSKIRPGETDEISVIAHESRMRPLVTFTHDWIEYTDFSLPFYTGADMLTVIVNADDIGKLFTGHTGASASEMTGFTVWLRITAGSSDTYISRRYEIDRDARAGRRLAWVNRYGAVDYYTFPYVTGGKVSGSRQRIYTSGGYRTVATAAEISETLLSEPCDGAAVKWLSEIFSSPAVWAIDGAKYDRVEVKDGSAEYSAEIPRAVAVSVGPVKKELSRKS